MASNTQTTEYKRMRRHKRAGRAGKNFRAIHGTTPAFPVHSADAVANAPVEQLKQADRDARS